MPARLRALFGSDGTIICVLQETYRPSHAENRMRGEGDVVAARKDYASRKSSNLQRLLQNRYDWMNRYIRPDAIGADIGCGTGLSANFIRAKHLFLTDYLWQDFLHAAGVDALNLPFRSGCFDFLIATNMIHHLPYPAQFFREAQRVLKPNGVLLMYEVNASRLMCAILRLTRHEGYSFQVDPFSGSSICTDPNDPWAGNNALPRLLFDDWKRFFQAFPEWELLYDEKRECLAFLNSGGVTAKTAYVPLPDFLLRAVEMVDDSLSAIAPEMFALGRRIALRLR
jgi:SAM-dependent methyltransferase